MTSNVLLLISMLIGLKCGHEIFIISDKVLAIFSLLWKSLLL